MKNFYHTLILWIPFVLLFSCAAFGVELIEGNKISTSEYFGPLLYIDVFLIAILYPISFLPLTLIVSKYVRRPMFKMALFTIGGGGLGIVVFNFLFEARFVEEYNLSMVPSILLFSVAGLLFALVEIAIKRNIKFV